MSTSPAYILAHMSWPEVEEALDSIRLAIVPTGSCEQHGPNMTMETDAAICHALAQRLTQRLHPRALLVPTVPWGVSPHHMNFPGTITLRSETYSALLHDIVASLNTHGLSHFLFVNGHGGNVASLDVTVMSLRRELDIQTAFMFWLDLAADVIAAGATTDRYGHACEVEASVGLALAPHIVKDGRQAGDLLPYSHPHIDTGSDTRVSYPFMFDELTANGALGDARQASREFGEEIVTTTLERAVEFAESFISEE